STSMPVKEVQTGMPVEKDKVYVIPPNFGMEMVDGNFKLVPRPSDQGLHMPVDHFLRSLAERCKTRAVGVILSGTNSDGSLGLQVINDRRSSDLFLFMDIIVTFMVNSGLSS